MAEHSSQAVQDLALLLPLADIEEVLEVLKDVLDPAWELLVQHTPRLKEILWDIVDTVFVPRVVGRQLALAIALDAGLMTLASLFQIAASVQSHFSTRSRLIRQLQVEQDNAATQDEWMELAERIDNIQSNDVWRSDPNCPLYERERIQARVDEFVHLMRRRDIFDLMFVLRGGIGRNKFGLLHEGLFSKALAGSKVLVETYHNVVCAALDFVCDAPVSDNEAPIPTDARLAFFNETRHSYGRTALLLSGGAALGFYHVGVVKTLMENRLMPRVLGGSSAGSIVCAMLGTRTDDECLQDFFQGKGTDYPGHSGGLHFNFFRPMPTKGEEEEAAAAAAAAARGRHGLGATAEMEEVYHNTARAFKDIKLTWQIFVPIGMRRFTSVLYDILTGSRRASDLLKSDTNHLREVCKANIGDFTFQEAFDRTGRILNIVVTPKNSSDPPRLLNYLTAPHVVVWSAAVASASLPGVFEANRLLVKDADGTERYESSAGQAFSDGSMEQDLPMQQLSEMFNVNHFIISQANPHAVMFASYNQNKSVWTNPFTGFLNSLLIFLKDQVRGWLSHVVVMVGGRRISPLFATQRDIGTQFFTQEYEGRESDISLIPWTSHRGLASAFLHCIYNPSTTEYHEWVLAAERETWKHLPAIKSHIAEEITLDRCVQRLRRRLVTERWEASQQNDSTGQKMGDRVPSFFTSPSLVNLSGLGVADQSNIEGILTTGATAAATAAAGTGSSSSGSVNNHSVPVHNDNNSNGNHKEYQMALQPTDDRALPYRDDPSMYPLCAQPVVTNNNSRVAEKNLEGWDGQGLRGNRSNNSLHRTNSDASGLFIDGDDDQQALNNNPFLQQHQSQEQVAGELTFNNSAPFLGSSINKHQGYLKSTSMAHFYYRRSAGTNHDGGGEERPVQHERKKSKSFSDLNTVGGKINHNISV